MENNTFINKLIKFSVPSIVSALVAICVLPVVSRVFPESEYGYISNFYSIGNLVLGICLLGLDSAYIRFFNEPIKNANRNGMFIFSIKIGFSICSILFILIFIFLRKKTSLYLFNDNSFIGVFLLYLYILVLIMYRMLNINNRFSEKIRIYNAQQVSFILSNRFLFIFSSIFSKHYIPAILIMLISTAAIVFISTLKQYNEFHSPLITNQLKKEMLMFAIPLMPTTIVVFLNNSIAKLILGGHNEWDCVGVLAIATSAANVFNVIPSAFSVYWGAFMYKYYKTEKELICNTHDVIMLLSVILVLGIFNFQDLIYLLLGPNYRSSQSYFMLIMLSPIFALISETTIYGINLSKKTHLTLYTAILGCLVNIVICFNLIPSYKDLGAAIGICFSSFFLFVFRTLLAQKEYRSINYFSKSICSCLFIIFICGINLILYNKLFFRFIFSLFILLILIFLYKNTINSLQKKILISINQFMRNKNEK